MHQCHIIRHYYDRQLAELNSSPRSAQDQGHVRRILQDWIQREKELLGNYLSLEQLLEQIQEESPQELHNIVQEVINAVNSFLSHQGVSADDVRRQLGRLDIELGQLYYTDEANQELLEQITGIQRTVRDTWLSLSRQQAWQIELRHVECLYDFFRTLERLCEPRILNTAPDVLKIALQAMFYLHLGLNESDTPEGHQSQIEEYSYYIPDAYFQTVKPIIIEARYLLGSRSNFDLYQENLTELSTTFIPYKTVYRYRPNPDSQPNPNISYLTVLSLEHRPDWVSDDRETVTIRLRSEGVTRGGIQFPKKIHVKFLESDSQGQQIVAFCPRCYAIHNIRHNRCNCHEELQRVKLYAQPIVERTYEALVEPRPITRSLSIIDQMRGSTIVSGSSVEARRVFWDAEVRYYRYIANVHPYSFDSLYDTPIQYGIPTKGITWNLASVVEQILPDNNLRQQVESVFIDGTHKELNEELVLHTASHLLHRAIAAISGVNEQELEYSYSEATPDNPPEVVVWERYEGGAGVSEVFENTLRTNPVAVYQELLGSILCPIDLAENPTWTSVEQLRAELAQRWCLPEDNELIVRVVEEAEAERQVQVQQQEQGEEERMMCKSPQGHDGCPACIHTTYCTERDNQDLSVSRMVGEAILRCFVQQVNREEQEVLSNQAIMEGFQQPPILEADLEQRLYDVLIL